MLPDILRNAKNDFIFCNNTSFVEDVYKAAMKIGFLPGRDFQLAAIASGVTFTGLGLLDRKGADENARILQVASQQPSNDPSKGDSDMDEKTKKDEEKAAEAAKNKPAGGAPDNPGTDDPQKRITELEMENKALKAKVAELQKRVEELEAERQAAANKSRARNLLAKLEKQGVDFGGDDEREMELKRLTELSDEAFAATEAAFSRMARKAKADAQAKEEKPDKPEKKEASIGYVPILKLAPTLWKESKEFYEQQKTKQKLSPETENEDTSSSI